MLLPTHTHTHTHTQSCLPSLEVVNGLLHSFLVVADHELVHVGIVGADVLLRAPIGHGAEA